MNASKNLLFITFMLTATIASAQSKKEIPPVPPKVATTPPPHAPKALVPEKSGSIHRVKPTGKMEGKLPPPPPPPLPPVPPPPPLPPAAV